MRSGSRAVQGIICVEAGMVFFVAQDAMMKSLLDSYPVWLLIFVRSLVALAVLGPLILWLGAPHRLFSPLWPLHFLRGLLFAIGFSLFYAAFPFMGLAEVTTIFFSAPLITALMAALWLKERIGPHRIGALITGFIGVLIAINPTASSFTAVSVLPLACAVFYSASQVLARQIGERDSSLTVGLNTLFFSGLVIMPLGWAVNAVLPQVADYPHLALHIPDAVWPDAPRLVLIGLIGMCGYVLISRAYQVADASLVAPFDYTYLPLALVLGYLLWNEVPPATTLVGMALIVGSGLYLGYRELRATTPGDEPALVGETVYAPAAPPLAQTPNTEQPASSDASAPEHAPEPAPEYGTPGRLS
ncbi:MAG: DMT family transporter [Pseudomonadota bacterium]